MGGCFFRSCYNTQCHSERTPYHFGRGRSEESRISEIIFVSCRFHFHRMTNVQAFSKVSKCTRKGFTLIEIVVVLAVFGILLGTMLPFSFQAVNMKRESKTLDELDALSKSVTGNPVIVINEARTSFGYIGDMGSFPTTLEDLYKKGSQPSYSFNTNLKTGAGWNGPYIDPKIVEHIETLKTDAFGNDFEYTTTPYTNSTVGQTVDARIRSNGRDGTSGTDDDLSVEFFRTQVKSKVFGFIKDNKGNGVAGVTITMNEPSSGVLTQKNTATDTTGFYVFDDITYGNRSLTIEPKLVLTIDSAVAKGATFNNVEFSVTNFSSGDISITSFKPVFTISPPAYFKELKIGGTSVYNSTSPRLGSGDTVTFSAKTVTGGGGVKESFPLRIQSPVTEVEDLSLGKLGKGASIKIEMKDFDDVQTGNGIDVDMTGVLFECTFSDGSVVAFTPVAG